MANERVTAVQYYSVLYLTMLSGILMYIATEESTVNGLNALLRPFVFFIINAVACIPVILLCSKCGGENLLTALEKRSRGLSVAVAAVYFAVFVFVTVKLAVRFDLFASSEMFPEKDMLILSVIMVIVCAVLGGFGFGGFARGAYVIAIIVTVSVLSVQFSLFKEIDFLNFTPLFENGAADFLSRSAKTTLLAVECGTLPLFFGSVGGNVKKGFYIWLGISSVVFLLVSFTVIGTLGIFTDTRLFPSYATVSLAKFGLFERVDSVETAVWISCVVVKITYYINAASRCVMHIFKNVPKRTASAFIGGGAAVLLALISSDILKHKVFAVAVQNFAVYVIPVVILPVISLIILKFKKVKPDENNS